uniref:Putative ovule protein n=1 Tax=Solanum chacoense TaxID=4108 RepID=A0A0V0GVK0_SOLCH
MKHQRSLLLKQLPQRKQLLSLLLKQLLNLRQIQHQSQPKNQRSLLLKQLLSLQLIQHQLQSKKYQRNSPRPRSMLMLEPPQHPLIRAMHMYKQILIAKSYKHYKCSQCYQVRIPREREAQGWRSRVETYSRASLLPLCC